MLRRNARRILAFAVAATLTGGVVIPVAIPLIALEMWDLEDPTRAGLGLFMGLILSQIASFFYLFAGVAAGCLLAPDEFMESTVGEPWMALIGTKHLLKARLVCATFVVAGALIAFGLGAAQVWMIQGPGLGR
jgi:hypothetical protein